MAKGAARGGDHRARGSFDPVHAGNAFLADGGVEVPNGCGEYGRLVR